MSNTISGSAASASAISTLLRAQSAGVIGLKVNQKATQAIIDQLQSNVLPNSSPAGIGGGSSTLPRGSLIDITA